jgi:hypothetical protein
MSEMTTTRQYVYESPEIEAYKMGLYGSAKDYMQQLQGFDADGNPIIDPATGLPIAPVTPPTQSVMGKSDFQTQAGDLVSQGIGGYEGYLTNAENAAAAGITALGADGAMGQMTEAQAQQMQGIADLNTAQTLATQRRDLPYAYRDQALTALNTANTNIGSTAGLRRSRCSTKCIFCGFGSRTAAAGIPGQIQASQLGLGAASGQNRRRWYSRSNSSLSTRPRRCFGSTGNRRRWYSRSNSSLSTRPICGFSTRNRRRWYSRSNSSLSTRPICGFGSTGNRRRWYSRSNSSLSTRPRRCGFSGATGCG